jgi:MFS transporter, DHA1 family, quinolone resistance protein
MELRDTAREGRNLRRIQGLTYLMFFMFAMTTDAVGAIIPRLILEFHLSLKAAAAFHYAPMAAIAGGAIMLGVLADRWGRKPTVVLGLALYGSSSLLFAVGDSFAAFVALLAISGLGVSIFKVGALALIGDISNSTADHTTRMNRVEGFFGVGAIIGPAIVAVLLQRDVSWKYLYVMASVLCGVLILAAVTVRYPESHEQPDASPSFVRTLRMMRDPYALGFSLLITLYVCVEVAVYVWMPTYLQGRSTAPAWLVAYSLSIFFALRAGGRFVGAWLLRRYSWPDVLAVFSCAIAGCFLGSLYGGVQLGAYLLPLSGLFMSVMYPTLNSKGISCFPRREHGAVAGVILFFTACAAAAFPLAMGALGDATGNVRSGFMLATAVAVMLFLALLLNRIAQPARHRLHSRDQSEYEGSV